MLLAVGCHFFEGESPSQLNHARKVFEGGSSFSSSIRELHDKFDFNSGVAFFISHINENKSVQLANNLGIDSGNSINFDALVVAITLYLKELVANGEEAITVSMQSLYIKSMSDRGLTVGQEFNGTDAKFLIEVGQVCPLSKERLLINSDHGVVSNYQIVRIYPQNLSEEESTIFEAVHKKPLIQDTDDNKIALSVNEAVKYANDKDPITYSKLCSIKSAIIETEKLNERLKNEDITGNISHVIQVLGSAKNINCLEQLSNKAVRIDEKLPPETDGAQNASIRGLVVRYYKFVDSLLTIEEKKDEGGNATELAKPIKEMSRILIESGKTPSQTIEKLKYELNERMGGGEKYLDACLILVAYFVQHCEALSK